MVQDPTVDTPALERLFLALADKTRLRLLSIMAGGPVAVGVLADRLGESQPKVSRHLAYMRESGIVTTRRAGKWIYYEIDYPGDRDARRVLETVVATLAGSRQDVGQAPAELLKEQPAPIPQPVPDPYDNYAEFGATTSRERNDDDELEVFLL